MRTCAALTRALTVDKDVATMATKMKEWDVTVQRTTTELGVVTVRAASEKAAMQKVNAADDAATVQALDAADFDDPDEEYGYEALEARVAAMEFTPKDKQDVRRKYKALLKTGSADDIEAAYQYCLLHGVTVTAPPSTAK